VKYESQREGKRGKKTKKKNRQEKSRGKRQKDWNTTEIQITREELVDESLLRRKDCNEQETKDRSERKRKEQFVNTCKPRKVRTLPHGVQRIKRRGPIKLIKLKKRKRKWGKKREKDIARGTTVG